MNLIGQAVEAGLEFYLESCTTVPDEPYQSRLDLARSHGRDSNFLSLLAYQGKLKATKRGSRWYAMPTALERYECQMREGRFQRGRPRRAAPPKEATES